MTEPRMAKVIRVERTKRGVLSLKIDGEEFPWLILDGRALTSVSRTEHPSVSVEILADKVEIVDDPQWQPLEG